MNEDNTTCMITRDVYKYEITGAGIVEETRTAYLIRKPYRTKKAWCDNCKSELDDIDYNYCPFCGKRFTTELNANTPFDLSKLIIEDSVKIVESEVSVNNDECGRNSAISAKNL